MKSTTVTKLELAERIAELGISRRYAKKLVDTICTVWAECLKRGEVLHLVGFGSFHVKTRQARQSRNPRTGEPVRVPEKKVIHFRAGKELKALLKNRNRG